MQMIGIAQFNLAANLPQVIRRDAAFDGGLSPYIHKNRRLHHAAVGTGKLTAPRAAFGFENLKHMESLLFDLIAARSQRIELVKAGSQVHILPDAEAPLHTKLPQRLQCLDSGALQVSRQHGTEIE